MGEGADCMSQLLTEVRGLRVDLVGARSEAAAARTDSAELRAELAELRVELQRMSPAPGRRRPTPEAVRNLLVALRQTYGSNEFTAKEACRLKALTPFINAVVPPGTKGAIQSVGRKLGSAVGATVGGAKLVKLGVSDRDGALWQFIAEPRV